MNFNEESKDFWGKLIYTARLTPQNIKSKITSYMFEKSISETEMVDEFILHSCFFVLNNHKKRILAQAVVSKQGDPNGYEVFRFLQIFKFLFPSHVDSEYYQNFKHVTETGDAIEGLSFAINVVGYTIYASTKDANVAKVSALIAFTPQLAKVFQISSYDCEDIARLAFEVLEYTYSSIGELESLRDEGVGTEDKTHLESFTSSIVNDGKNTNEMLKIAIEDYNKSFYSFIESVKQSKNKTLLRIMKSDILDESFTVINEEIKPEIVNYLKLI